jgi:hypothetical protein
MAEAAAEDEHEGSARSRKTLLVAGSVVAAALLVLGVVAVVARGDEPSPEERAAAATDAAESWLEAWTEDDRPALRRLLARRSPALGAALDAFRDGLRPEGIEADAGRARLAPEDRATVPFEAEVDLAPLGTWQYDGELPLIETDEGWRVEFAPAVLHPGLVNGRTLLLHTERGARGQLLATDGVPLPVSPGLRSIIGTLGPADDARAAELGPTYRAGDVVGTSGLQAGLEDLLAGTPTGEVRLVEGEQVVSVEETFAGTPGQDVRTTLDLRIVDAAQEALGTEGGAAALVAIQPSTGGVRAVANRPGNGYNRALLGRYPPGSTFKVVTTVALLTHGVTPATRVGCPKEIDVNGRTIRNAEEEELGDIDFATAFEHSCNTAFIDLAQRLQPADLEAAARSLGFNEPPDAGLAVATSEFPTPSGPVDLVSSAIGQGRVLATPFQMASVAATIAAGGYRPPRLVEVPALPELRPLPEGVAPTIQELMRRAVRSGTGTRARLGGTPVAGKTGTAEFGTAVPLRTHAWFIAFRGDLAVAVIVEDGGFGGEVAAPIAARFLSRVGA